MDVVISAGLGGGSLIYANVFLEPPGSHLRRTLACECEKEKPNFIL